MDEHEAPQPYNVPLGPEGNVTPHGVMPLLVAMVLPVPQNITGDADLYPRQSHGVLPGVVR